MKNYPSKKKLCYFCKTKLRNNPWALFKWETTSTNTMELTPEDLASKIIGYSCDNCHKTRFEES